MLGLQFAYVKREDITLPLTLQCVYLALLVLIPLLLRQAHAPNVLLVHSVAQKVPILLIALLELIVMLLERGVQMFAYHVQLVNTVLVAPLHAPIALPERSLAMG